MPPVLVEPNIYKQLTIRSWKTLDKIALQMLLQSSVLFTSLPSLVGKTVDELFVMYDCTLRGIFDDLLSLRHVTI